MPGRREAEAYFPRAKQSPAFAYATGESAGERRRKMARFESDVLHGTHPRECNVVLVHTP
jgi:hypothetical protein